jgi:lipopolysaccharide transport system ATP-binding protein
MSESVIKAEGLGKKYIIGHQGTRGYKTFREQMLQHVHNFYSRTKKLVSGQELLEGDELEDFWALKDLNFEIKKGDRVGIIGKNGAGKSTLLKILSRITEPTTGCVSIKGRVASLLEVGTGFHPELSGRENIFLNGAILGMSRAEIKRKFDEIVDFSGVEKFLDTPVKRYSSGMYVRLAFSVAAHLEPEILIVDEVLAVGDAEFQKKCLGKMQDVSINDGRTIIFVSHDLAAVSKLTSRAIYLSNGSVSFYGKINDAINHYLKTALPLSGVYRQEPDTKKPSFARIQVYTSEQPGVHKNGEKLSIELDINMTEIIEGMSVSIQIINEKELPVIFSYIFDVDRPILRSKGISTLKCTFPDCRLYEGKYYLRVHLAESKGRVKFQEIDRICEFEVKMLDDIIEWGWQKDVCIYTEDQQWEIIK